MNAKMTRLDVDITIASGASLRGETLSELDLSEVDLTNVDLRGCDLRLSLIHI